MKIFKSIIKKIVAFPFVWRTIGALIRRPGIVVLMYHRVTPDDGPFSALPLDTFYKQMLWLKQNCNILHPDDFISQINKTSYSRPFVLITFDDGQRCVHDVIYPVLKEMGISGIVFLATTCMDNGGLIWTDEVSWAMMETKRDSIKLPWSSDSLIKLTSVKERNNAARICKKYMKSLPDSERLHWQELLLQELDAGDPALKLNREMLNWDEVRACQDVFEFGGHTHTHPIMSQLEYKSLENEIVTCRDRMMKELGTAPTTFAYPNGEARDYNQDCKDVLTKHGFKTAFTTIEGINTDSTNLLELKRIPTAAQNVEDLAWMILRA
ncbi:MAG: polysaccharide deacetylase family protein [Thiohalomonadales bacterium]